ncbi:hypothetical protein [Flavobacterium sediminis]|nr:hypothetical protein [Flavobacterium sediminis]
MMPFLFIAFVISLLFIFWQDVKFRHIHIVLPVITFISAYFLSGWHFKILKITVINLLFLVVTLGVLVLYMSGKKKQLLNPFTNYFGLGDLLFYIAITPLFLLHQYILFFVLSMIFAIVAQKIFRKYIQHNSVPLAGLSALLLLIFVIKDIMIPYQKITLIRW